MEKQDIGFAQNRQQRFNSLVKNQSLVKLDKSEEVAEKAIKKTPYCANNVKNKHNKYEKEHVPVKEAELDVKRGEY